jgi:hypothetical protein
MAKPNYSYEKRQRELAKKKKQEEKRQRKAAHRADGAAGHEEATDAGADAPAPDGDAKPAA